MMNVTMQSALPSFERVPSWTRQTPRSVRNAQTRCNGDPSVQLENSAGVNFRLVDGMFPTCNPPVLAAGDALCLFPFITCSTSSISAKRIQFARRCSWFRSLLTGVSYLQARSSLHLHTQWILAWAFECFAFWLLYWGFLFIYPGMSTTWEQIHCRRSLATFSSVGH